MLNTIWCKKSVHVVFRVAFRHMHGGIVLLSVVQIFKKICYNGSNLKLDTDICFLSSEGNKMSVYDRKDIYFILLSNFNILVFKVHSYSIDLLYGPM